MELIERYVYQVGRRLPKRLREDVVVELRSLLMDTLEERSGEGPISEDDQVAVLKEFGSPAQMAAKYQPQSRYIIGPKMYDLYLLVLAVVIGAGFLASGISTVVSSTTASPDAVVDVFTLLGRGLVLFLNIIISGVGSTTLIFAFLERVIPTDEVRLGDEAEWDPRELPAVEMHNQIKPRSLIVQTAFLVLLLFAFIAFPQRINVGVYYDAGGWHTISSILSPAFFTIYLPLIEIAWVAKVVLNLVLLRQGRWQLGTRIAEVLLQLWDIFILVKLILGPSILSSAVFANFPEVAVAPPVAMAFKVAFFVALVMVAIETVTQVYRLFRPQIGKSVPVVEV